MNAEQIIKRPLILTEKGQLMRVLNYSDIGKFGSRTLPATMEMIPTTKVGTWYWMVWGRVDLGRRAA